MTFQYWTVVNLVDSPKRGEQIMNCDTKSWELKDGAKNLTSFADVFEKHRTWPICHGYLLISQLFHKVQGWKRQGQRAFWTAHETDVITNQTSYLLLTFFPHPKWMFLDLMSSYTSVVLFCSFRSMFHQLFYRTPKDEAESQS